MLKRFEYLPDIAWTQVPQTAPAQTDVHAHSIVDQALALNKVHTGDQRDLEDMRTQLDQALAYSGKSVEGLSGRELLTLTALLVDTQDDSASSFFVNTSRKLGLFGDEATMVMAERAPVRVQDFHDELKVSRFIRAFVNNQPSVDERRMESTIGTEENDPAIVISSGGPSVGKSVMLTALERKQFFPEDTLFLRHNFIDECFNQDDRNRHFHPEILDENQPYYQEAVRRLVNWAVENRYSVAMEDHIHDPEFMAGMLGDAKEQGYGVYATGLLLDAETYKQHRKDKGELHAGMLPMGVQMTKDFTRKWEELMSTGVVDYGAMMFRVKQQGAPHWNTDPLNRVIKAAEYFNDPDTGDPTAIIHEPVTIAFAAKGGWDVDEREIDGFEEFRKWQTVKINHDAPVGNFEAVFAGEDGDPGHYSGRVVDRREENAGEARPEPNRFNVEWENTLS